MKQKIADIINVLFGFRKLLLLLLICLIAVIFRLKELINGAEMVDLLKSTAIAFIGANGVEHIVGVAKQYIDSKAPVHGDNPATPYEDLVTPSAVTEPEEKEDTK